MQMYVISVRDIKADSFGKPFYTLSLGEAVRSFGDEVNRSDQQNLLYMHPDDFELFHLGFFESDDGRFELLPQPKQIAVASTMKVLKQ